MLMTKKSRIRKYLASIEPGSRSPFAWLLSYYIDGTLSDRLQQAGIRRPEIAVDFFDDFKCIGIQGKHDGNYVDIQVEEESFSIASDPDEPEEYDRRPLESAESFFAAVSEILGV